MQISCVDSIGANLKTITFVVPAYNSEQYLDRCVVSIVSCADDIEIIIVDDGSVDDTALIAASWQQRYPDKIVVISKENGGHGSAVNTGLANARGRYFKVVDSDDWLDTNSMIELMPYLRLNAEKTNPTDMVIANYVYEKLHLNERLSIDYKNIFPEGREFGWSETGRFYPSQYILMHSVIYRTDLLRDIGLTLPEHTFYVDNIFVYVPLPHVKTMYYRDLDLYRYLIGREDQSVNEKNMVARVDQQLFITKLMIDSVDLTSEVKEKKLVKYMENYLSIMMAIASIFLRIANTEESEEKRLQIWAYLKEKNPDIYKKVKHNAVSIGTNLPTELGRRLGVSGYRIAQTLLKFN